MSVRVLAVCMILALTAGCGCEAGSDEHDVRSVVSSYVRASADGNGEQACALYTARLRAEIERKARNTGLAGCAELLGTALRYRLSLLPADVRAAVTDTLTEPGRVDVELGDDGRAQAALTLPDRPTLDTRVMLVREPAGWRIERLGIRWSAGRERTGRRPPNTPASSG